jgi:hypothetical protein
MARGGSAPGVTGGEGGEISLRTASPVTVSAHATRIAVAVFVMNDFTGSLDL